MGLDALLDAFLSVLNGGSLTFLVAGVLLGLTFGVIPGLGGTTALALLIPVTYTLDPLSAMYLAGGVMGATSFGGSISAILLNTPGTAPNAATCFDGYPLARQGKAGMAIGASATASALGGLIGLFTLLLFIPVAREVVLSFGSSEFFLLTVLGLAAIAVSIKGKLLRGLIAACIGLLLAFTGANQFTGETRFTGGINYLWEGIPLVPALTGLFAISQILLRGSLIGTVIGAIPGLGGTVASFLSYSSTAQTAKDRDTFGKGNIKGVIAPEAANNAKDGGSLIPTVAFGIPGSAETAVFLGILVLHGIEPGPQILLQNEREIYGLIVALTVSAIAASVLGLIFARLLVLITRIDVNIVVPVVVTLSLTGVYVLEGRMADVAVATIIGIFGYLMIRFDYPRLTLVIAFVLGEIAERSYHQVRLISDGNVMEYMLDRPISVILIIATIITFFLPAMRKLPWRRMVGRAI